tara:strand:+ start:3310 stop:3453 length:144 start_codon:yes stop_codon:yes gene_type:complete
MDYIYDNITNYEFGFNNDGDMVIKVNNKEIKLVDLDKVLKNMNREVN